MFWLKLRFGASFPPSNHSTPYTDTYNRTPITWFLFVLLDDSQVKQTCLDSYCMPCTLWACNIFHFKIHLHPYLTVIRLLHPRAHLFLSQFSLFPLCFSYLTCIWTYQSIYVSSRSNLVVRVFLSKLTLQSIFSSQSDQCVSSGRWCIVIGFHLIERYFCYNLLIVSVYLSLFLQYFSNLYNNYNIR